MPPSQDTALTNCLSKAEAETRGSRRIGSLGTARDAYLSNARTEAPPPVSGCSGLIGRTPKEARSDSFDVAKRLKNCSSCFAGQTCPAMIGDNQKKDVAKRGVTATQI
ncbi:uncharacterized protein LY79DRAFT_276220 [Colletotrichum navitas]|uniref:Uncharacterized protein n=1 Tax=Colletotrichum navitas TaxID=681940 RepID=A0AAD8PV23_9PEZI|nr:uncharacterized protein LY79DRAFT_276220 [Colletotrichum navitas]KAK1585161.1 hypothetical protein LY79DRAFT_276220 [Colletotrichum navitas]